MFLFLLHLCQSVYCSKNSAVLSDTLAALFSFAQDKFTIENGLHADKGSPNANERLKVNDDGMYHLLAGGAVVYLLHYELWRCDRV